jgi:hypothetical protein
LCDSSTLARWKEDQQVISNWQLSIYLAHSVPILSLVKSTLSKLFLRHPVRLSLLLGWLILLLLLPDSFRLITEYGGFIALGITGAIFANATGAGGGVVFVPFINHLGFDATTIVATSFAIQCCGMTAGAITWYRFFHDHHDRDPEWQGLGRILMLTVPMSILGIWLVQGVEFSGLVCTAVVSINYTCGLVYFQSC